MTDEEKDPIAQAMVAKRWAKTSAAQRKQVAQILNEARWAGHKKAGGKVKAKTKSTKAPKRAK
jgi:hypothetical protein